MIISLTPVPYTSSCCCCCEIDSFANCESNTFTNCESNTFTNAITNDISYNFTNDFFPSDGIVDSQTDALSKKSHSTTHDATSIESHSTAHDTTYNKSNSTTHEATSDTITDFSTQYFFRNTLFGSVGNQITITPALTFFYYNVSSLTNSITSSVGLSERSRVCTVS